MAPHRSCVVGQCKPCLLQTSELARFHLHFVTVVVVAVVVDDGDGDAGGGGSLLFVGCCLLLVVVVVVFVVVVVVVFCCLLFVVCGCLLSFVFFIVVVVENVVHIGISVRQELVTSRLAGDPFRCCNDEQAACVHALGADGPTDECGWV